MNSNDGGPAFPSVKPDENLPGFKSDKLKAKYFPGMSLRAYAAIHLRVPDSGLDWLDKMIVQSQRDQFAGMPLNETEINCVRLQFEATHPDSKATYTLAEARYFHASALLAERNKAL